MRCGPTPDDMDVAVLEPCCVRADWLSVLGLLGKELFCIESAEQLDHFSFASSGPKRDRSTHNRSWSLDI
jgi:hypothetical protein